MITKRDASGRIAKGSNLKHGRSNDPVYDVWVAMKARCENPNHPMWKHYGGRGIKVCDRWRVSFISFIEDMGEPSGLTLDRIDNNEGYKPGNCRWISIQEQQRNRRNNNQVVGVHFERSRGKWHADITFRGKKVFLGRFASFEEARLARQEAEKNYV